jgi:hypothetical protein
LPNKKKHTARKPRLGQAAFLGRCGESLAKLVPTDDASEDQTNVEGAFEKVYEAESKLRDFLLKNGTQRLPDRKLQEPRKVDDGDADAGKHASDASGVLCLAPCSFRRNGQISRDNLSWARDLQIGIGSLVTIKRTNMLAKITTLTASAIGIVGVDAVDESLGAQTVKMQDIEPAQTPKKGAKAAVPAPPPDTRKPAQKWMSMPVSDVDIGVLTHVQLMLFNLQSCCSPDEELVRLHEGNNGEDLLSMDKDAKEGVVAFIPYSWNIELVEPGALGWTRAPKRRRNEKTAEYTIYVKAYLKGKEESACYMRVLPAAGCHFWKFLSPDNDHLRTTGLGTLQWHLAKTEMCLKGTLQDKDSKKTALKYSTKFPILIMEFPYLTNDMPLKTCSLLQITAKNPPNPYFV